MRMKVYMQVTRDKYQLPVAVDDSPKELAELCGCSANAVSSALSRLKSGQLRRPRFVCVEINDDTEANSTGIYGRTGRHGRLRVGVAQRQSGMDS